METDLKVFVKLIIYWKAALTYSIKPTVWYDAALAIIVQAELLLS
jgi:hypothetical protein